LLPIARTHADVVTDWNVIALNATAVPPNSILQSRTLAIVHGAIYDAARAVDRKSGAYAIDIDAPAGTSVDAAVVAAAHGALVRLAPAERQMLDAALNVSLSKIADGQGKTEGTALGQQIAEKLVALRSTDGAAVKVVFSFPMRSLAGLASAGSAGHDRAAMRTASRTILAEKRFIVTSQ
jgi:hypothetical protein